MIALVIAAALWPLLSLDAGLAAGASFYIGREVRDREKLGTWDWPGLVAPVSACLAVKAISVCVQLIVH